MSAESSELAAPAGLRDVSLWRGRDPRLWIAIGGALAIKLALIWLQLGVFVRSAWLQPAFADLRAWSRFVRAVKAGGVPYLDVPCDAPVLAASWSWIIAKLSVWLPFAPSRPLFVYHAALALAVDALNVGLLYAIAREIEVRSALRACLVFCLTGGVLLFAPTYAGGLFVSCLLLAYRLQQRPRAAAAAWSIASGFHGFGWVAFAASELQHWSAGDRSRWRQTLPVFAGVQLLLNAPFALAGFWTGRRAGLFAEVLELGASRYAPDTALGLLRIWLGPTPLHAIALPLSAALAVWAAVKMRRSELPEAIVVVAIAAMLFYPHASASWQLWLYPFLLVIALRAATEPRAWLLTAYLALDLSLVAGSSFLAARARRELGAFTAEVAVEKGAAWTLLFSAAVVLKLVLLAVIAREVARGAVPAATLPAPLGWPRVDRARWTGWLRHRSIPTWIAWAFIVGQSLYIGAAVWESARYSDEIHHVPQIERFARGNTEYSKDLTTLPGYHIVSAAIANARGELGRAELRQVNLAWGLAATFFAFLSIRGFGARAAPSRAVGFHFMPMLLPYMFFVYTDVLALALTVLSVYLMLNRRWAVAGLVGAVSISVRQSNVLVLVLIALVALAEEDRTQPLWSWVRSLLAKTWTSALGLLGFAAFVIHNGGIAVGDRGSHEMGLHFGNLTMGLALLALCALPVNLERVWTERARLSEGSYLIALGLLFFAYCYLFKVEHIYNWDSAFVRNAIFKWASGGPLERTLFFVPVALGFSALWFTPLSRRSLWVWVIVGLIAVIPERLVEQRYTIVPIALWMIFRCSGSAFAERLTAVMNVWVSTWLLYSVVSGRFFL